jgi:hypothetical protein
MTLEVWKDVLTNYGLPGLLVAATVSAFVAIWRWFKRQDVEIQFRLKPRK